MEYKNSKCNKVFPPQSNLLKCVISFFVFFILYLALSLSPSSVHATSPLNMLFIYPGGEGSTIEAQPFLNALFEVIQKNGGPIISGKYIIDQKEGHEQIKKADLAIVTLDFYLEEGNSTPMEILLSTQPLGSPSAHTSYTLLSLETSMDDVDKIYLSRPMNQSLLTNVLIKKGNASLFEVKTNIVSTMKKIVSGELHGSVLLDPFQLQVLEQLKFPWLNKFHIIYKTQEVPSAPLVLIKKLPEEVKQEIIRSFKEISKAPNSKTVLESLRLTGFVEPNLDEFENLFKVYQEP